MTNTTEQIKEEKDYFNGLIAIQEGQIIGFATYFFAYFSWTGKSLYLDDLYVKQAYRQLGVGKKLLDAVIDIAKENKCKKMRWQVSHWNHDAQAFYKKLGAEIDDNEWNCDLWL